MDYYRTEIFLWDLLRLVIVVAVVMAMIVVVVAVLILLDTHINIEYLLHHLQKDFVYFPKGGLEALSSVVFNHNLVPNV